MQQVQFGEGGTDLDVAVPRFHVSDCELGRCGLGSTIKGDLALKRNERRGGGMKGGIREGSLLCLCH